MINSLSILVVDDEEITTKALSGLLKSLKHRVLISHNGEEALNTLSHENIDLMITDLMMPGMDGFALVKKAKKLYPELLIFIFTGYDSFSLARKAQKLGSDDYLLKPVDKDQLDIALNQANEKIQLKKKIANLGKLVEEKYSISNIIGSSKPMKQVFRLIERARSTQANVLIRGKSGTGKELVARAIFSNKAALTDNFVHVNCCAIAEGLFESELFGHVKGAFSGAIANRKGLFEMANNGTIFLDEIGDISPGIQMKLLRTIQEREIRRVGENITRKVKVRIIAATNKDLEEAVKKGTFREDLYYRLNVIPINLPSLKDRLSDIPLLVSHFLKKHSSSADEEQKEFTSDALNMLQTYNYPGNVRELENIIQRALSFTSGDKITSEDLGVYLKQTDKFISTGEDSFSAMSFAKLKDYLRGLEKDFLISCLKRSGCNVLKTSQEISLSRTALHNRINALKIDLDDMRRDKS